MPRRNNNPNTLNRGRFQAQGGGLEKLDDTRIKKMAKVCKRYGERIAVGADGHIKISDRKDFETVIKARCDYYKKGEVSGKSYGTFSGRELKEVGEMRKEEV